MKCSGIVCYGDSNTYGFDPRSFSGDRYDENNRWCNILEKNLGCRVINLGLNGRPVPVCSCRNLSRVLSENQDCDTLIIMLGTNDLLLGQKAGHISDKMEKLILQFLKPGLKTVLLSPPKLRLEEEKERELVNLSGKYRELSEKLGCFFCDCGAWELELCYDGIHLTEKANRLFAEKLAEFLKKA